MSLFIGSLAFPDEGYDVDIRIAVLIASLVSAVSGYLLLRSGSVAPQLKSTVTTS
jgi:NhaA family Na+:H+ antiporter